MKIILVSPKNLNEESVRMKEIDGEWCSVMGIEGLFRGEAVIKSGVDEKDQSVPDWNLGLTGH